MRSEERTLLLLHYSPNEAATEGIPGAVSGRVAAAAAAGGPRLGRPLSQPRGRGRTPGSTRRRERSTKRLSSAPLPSLFRHEWRLFCTLLLLLHLISPLLPPGHFGRTCRLPKGEEG